MVEFDPNKKHHPKCAYDNKYYPHLGCTCQEKYFNERQDLEVKKWRPVFTRVGFREYAIDFSYVEPDIIECMGKALENYLDNKQADNMPECSPYSENGGY